MYLYQPQHEKLKEFTILHYTALLPKSIPLTIKIIKSSNLN